MRALRAVMVVLALAANSPAVAVQPGEMLADPVLEARARALSKELRCMVCQNQSIDDSDAPLARDLRVLVRERLTAGDSDTEVIDYLTGRYGEFVLLRPRLSWATLLLWLAPLIALGAGIAGVVVTLRRRNSLAVGAASEPQLSAAEQARLAELLDRPPGSGQKGA